MEKKKIGELIESDTNPAVYRRANGKTYCLLSAVTVGHNSSGGVSSPVIVPKRQVEVEVEDQEAFPIGEQEEVDLEEEVEVLWDGEPKAKGFIDLDPSDEIDDIPY